MAPDEVMMKLFVNAYVVPVNHIFVFIKAVESDLFHVFEKESNSRVAEIMATTEINSIRIDVMIRFIGVPLFLCYLACP
jgi:hypothetical protein